MTNINNKYKDKKPLETIQNIQDFFKSKGLSTRIVNEQMSGESGTWSCGVEVLDYNGNFIFSSCGKGMTKDFSRASGHAEAYERFCNGVNNKVYNNSLLIRKIMEMNLKEKGYYLHPEEKELSFEEVYNIPAVNNFYLTCLGNDANVKKYFEAITNGRFIGVPYENIKRNGDIKYYDPRILSRVTTTIGMSAGNTIEEALNQGLSEVFEVFVTDAFYENKVKETYFIDKNTITNEELLKTIQKIEDNGFKLYILDLSYNFNMPVVASVLVNTYNYNVSFNFGSFPVFDIALERVLTELYQGISQYKDAEDNPQIPYRTNDFRSEMMSHLNNRTGATIFPEDLFLKNKQNYCGYNKEVFLQNKDLSNKDINQYYIDLSNSLGLELYFRDVSQDEKIKAIQIFSEDLLFGEQKAKSFMAISPILKTENANLIYNLYKLINNIVDNEDYMPYLKRIIKFIYDNQINGMLLGNLLFSDWSLPVLGGSREHLFYLFQLISFAFAGQNAGIHLHSNDIISKEFKYFRALQTYLNANAYTEEEIMQFLSLFGRESIKEDFEIIKNPELLFKTIYVKKLQELYFSKDYEKYVNIFRG